MFLFTTFFAVLVFVLNFLALSRTLWQINENKHLNLLGDRSKIEKLVQMSWTFINDSLSTSLCLQWEPQIIAVAVMYLAGK